ncbi:DAK2 domain-containing protein [Kitasatospora sp. NBC_00315]|uniref:DAK2 domain-containing protein n=1 Tax=Kitasatospora sp. NBC_00315 TaxID=2975963 RepID=UPI003248F6C2
MDFDGTFTEEWMRRFAMSVAATERELTAFDQQVGDGDFGANLRTGTGFAVAALDRLPPGPRTAAAPLRTAATAFLDEVGGTSGPLFGLVLQELAVAVGPGLTSATLAAGVTGGLAAVQRVGDAQPGDKTLVDALDPAARALQALAPDVRPDEALAIAADAAFAGVRSTMSQRARRGRASYLGERASGVPDPGALGVGVLFASAGRQLTGLAEFLRER